MKSRIWTLPCVSTSFLTMAFALSVAPLSDRDFIVCPIATRKCVMSVQPATVRSMQTGRFVLIAVRAFSKGDQWEPFRVLFRNRDVSLDVFFGVDYHSHLERVEQVWFLAKPDGSFGRQIHSIENTPFRTKLSMICRSFRVPV